MKKTATWSDALGYGLFYESDCQGQTSSLLIARRFLPWQSALSSERTRSCGASGYAGQFSSASFTSFPLSIRLDACKRVGSRGAPDRLSHLRGYAPSVRESPRPHSANALR